MTVTEILDSVVNWCKTNICDKIELKAPVGDTPGRKEPIDHSVKYVHPAAFALFVPGKDRLPPNVTAPIPAICVQLMEGHDQIVERKRAVTVRLCLSAWNPGTQSGELFFPHVDTSRDIPRKYTQGDGERQFYDRNFDGWRDVWNFVDKTLRAVEDADSIGEGLLLDRSEGVKYGPFQEDGTIWDYYPYWHSWVSFKLEGELVTAIPHNYNELL